MNSLLLAVGEADKAWHEVVVGLVWGWPLIILCVGAGIIFTVAMKGVQFRAFGHALQVVRGRYDNPDDHGEISHFKALTSALSATVGLGNIAGVAIAISKGGPGAIFWMWIIGVLGMATKFTECTLAMKFRHEFADGHVGGGPMYTIEKGLGASWKWMAALFAVLAIAASFGGGNMFQTNQAAATMHSAFGVDQGITGAVIAGVVAVVIIGGIKRIGQVTSKLVPLMCGIYVVGALFIIGVNIGEVPAKLWMIVQNAFSLDPIIGGTLGVVIAQGVRRATFSNEAGFGSAAMAHAAAKTDEPVREGAVASLGPFIDTIIICTMTALVIIFTLPPEYLASGSWSGTTQGVTLTMEAFDAGITGFGTYFVPVAVLLFAVSTVISWSYYGEKGTEYLARRFMGTEAMAPAVAVYRGVFCIAAFMGSVWSLDVVLNVSDSMLGLMAVPNLLACLLLTPMVMKMSQSYFKRLKAGEFKVYK